ncbi:TolC family protein [Altererythrobacter sp. RZ02]|uniref:TolC family protein n=1 Tax=Pontixanthobacter rizhaonensis TaxID=2730337 RepID=A0A848QKW4_9SPHN|nr:TolC family protein [Pontixanthobacter rizhaonensis]NMW31247.1 TolC family protein [Pontixanthobacter rizhaonensis]
MYMSLRAAFLAGAFAVVGTACLAEPISLDQAVDKAIEAAPILKANEAAIAAAEAGKRQADVRPNPVVSAETENFIGTGPVDIFRQAEVTFTYSQQIERGGKRAARIGLGESEVELAKARARAARLDIAANVQRAYIDAQIAATVVRIASERLGIERELQREALRRVRGYKDPLFVETRSAARVAEAELGLREAEFRLRNAQNALAAYWGGEGQTVEVAPDLNQQGLATTGLADADTAVAEAAIDRSRSAVVVEQTRATQDYTITGGLRYLRDTDDVAAVAGISIPIGRFDKNQGNIERAQAERRQTEFLAEADRLARLRRLASLRADSDAALTRANGIITDVYPKTVRTLEQVREGYNRGGFRFSDIEDASNAIIAAQESWLDAMNRYRDLQPEIDRLTGRFDVAAAEESTQ